MTQRPPRCQLAFNSSLAVGKTSLVVTCLGLIRNRRAGANVLRVKKARGERASIQSAASWRTLLVIQMRDRQSGRRLTIERRTNVSPRMLRSPAIRRRVRASPPPRFTQFGWFSGGGLSRPLLGYCRAATSQLNIWFTSLRAGGPFRSFYALIPYRRPTYPVCALSVQLTMREHIQGRWAARLWYRLVGFRWQRLQSRICGFYFRGVTQSVQFWVACGCPSEFVPSLPWWQPLVWRWLALTGASRLFPRLPRRGAR